MTCIILAEKADQITKELKIDDFNFNLSWIGRFKKRHSIKFGAVSGEACSVNFANVEEWIKNTWSKLRKNYKEENIFNGDETGLFYKLLPNKTLAFKGDQCCGEKMSKERLTAFLCSSMKGEKHQPIIMGKYSKPRCFKNKNLDRIHYHANRKA